MGIKRLVGQQGETNASNASEVFVADGDNQLQPAMEQVQHTTAGTTTLPEKPYAGECHLLVALDGDISVDGGTHPVSGGPITVPSGFQRSFTFSADGRWITGADVAAIVSWAWDLVGSTNTKQQVSGLTGLAGVTTIRDTSPAVIWEEDTVSPSLSQADRTTDAPVYDLTFKAQNAAPGAVDNPNGGSIIFHTGGGTSNGKYYFYDGPVTDPATIAFSIIGAVATVADAYIGKRYIITNAHTDINGDVDDEGVHYVRASNMDSFDWPTTDQDPPGASIRWYQGAAVTSSSDPGTQLGAGITLGPGFPCLTLKAFGQGVESTIQAESFEITQTYLWDGAQYVEQGSPGGIVSNLIPVGSSLNPRISLFNAATGNFNILVDPWTANDIQWHVALRVEKVNYLFPAPP